MDFNSIEDRALSEHRGSGLFMKKSNGKYSLLLPVEGTGENGSAPEALEKTAIGNKQKTYEEGRQDNPQKTLPFYAHRDNLVILEGIKGQTNDFLRLLPDFTAVKFSGKLSYKLNNTDVGSLEQGEITITPTSSDEFVANAYALVEDTVAFVNQIDDVVYLAVAGTKAITVVTDPVDATLAVENESASVATAAFGTGETARVLTLTGVAEGSTVVTVTVSKTGYASFKRSILVIVA